MLRTKKLALDKPVRKPRTDLHKISTNNLSTSIIFQKENESLKKFQINNTYLFIIKSSILIQKNTR